MIVPAEMPSPFVVVVVPDEGRVVIFVDPRVPARVTADTAMRVRAILHGTFRAPNRAAVRRRLADMIGPAHALG